MIDAAPFPDRPAAPVPARRARGLLLAVATFAAQSLPGSARDLETLPVEGQPLGANALRLLEALDYLGHPLPEDTALAVREAARGRDAPALQRALDPQVLVAVDINPEYRVKARRGPAPARIVQSGYTPFLVKVANAGTITAPLGISSPQAGPVYAGAALNSLRRQQQTGLASPADGPEAPDAAALAERFLDLEVFGSPPMTTHLSGLEVEYVLALVHSTEAGRREATLHFDVGQGTEDLGFRGEVPVLFDILPAVPVVLDIRDHDGTPTTARLEFRNERGRVHPPQPKRVAPDLFFQPQIYREDGESVLLAPGRYTLASSRGPEYQVRVQEIEVAPDDPARVEVRLERWVDPMSYGFFCGDHHIHAAGCAHYTVPTEGVDPADIFRQVKGEGLNVGCVLTWGYCFDHQRQFFSPDAAGVSEDLTLIKYDLEISGFGSARMGHVCLLNLSDQVYPGSEGTEGWPTWTVPVLRWTKEQGGVTGFPHSDMRVDIPAYVKRYFARHDRDGDGRLDRAETEAGLLPAPFEEIDGDRDGRILPSELAEAAERASHQLPNLVLPAMSGSGAMEIFVAVAEGVCDFISAMDTGRVGEWNTWYHIMNSGFPLKVSGESDFPCMSGRNVGQGRVYVKLDEGPRERIDFQEWIAGLAAGRSYVSDGYAHALEFTVGDAAPGFGKVRLEGSGEVVVRAKVAFAPRIPKAVAYGTEMPPEGRLHLGDTRVLHGPRSEEWIVGGERVVEIVRNGEAVARATVPADGAEHELAFTVGIDRSSWVALRHFPQLHTNPVEVIVADRPIRASRASALWCAESIELLWERRGQMISEEERPAAEAAYQRAAALFRARAEEAGEWGDVPDQATASGMPRCPPTPLPAPVIVRIRYSAISFHHVSNAPVFHIL